MACKRTRDWHENLSPRKWLNPPFTGQSAGKCLQFRKHWSAKVNHVLYPALDILSALAAAPQFDVQLLDGSRVSGSLVRWDAAKLVVETSTGRTTLDAAKLASVTPQSPPANSAAKPAVWVDLVNGSQLAAGEYTVEKGRARIAFSAAEVMVVPTAEIDAVRFQPASDATALEWSRIRGKKIRGDVLVTGNSNAIDYHEGAIEDVTDKKVRFTLNGQTKVLGVKRAKVFGLIYYHATAAASRARSPYTIVDSAGSRWVAASLKLSGGQDRIHHARRPQDPPRARSNRQDRSLLRQDRLPQRFETRLGDLHALSLHRHRKRARQPPGVLAGPPRPESRIEVVADPRAGLPQGTGPAQPQRVGLDLARQVQPLGGSGRHRRRRPPVGQRPLADSRRRQDVAGHGHRRQRQGRHGRSSSTFPACGGWC